MATEHDPPYTLYFLECGSRTSAELHRHTFPLCPQVGMISIQTLWLPPRESCPISPDSHALTAD